MEDLKGKWFKLTKSAYNDYIHFVQNNENDSFYIAEKKINRNIQSGQYLRTGNTEIVIVGYGSLRMGLRDGVVVWVENRVYPPTPIDYEIKEKFEIKHGLKTIEIEEADSVENIKEEIDPQYEGVSILHKLMAWFGLDKLHS